MNIKTLISQVFDGTNISSDDAPVSRRFVYNELLPTRSELIKQELNKNRLLDGSFAQTIEGFRLVEMDISQRSDFKTMNVLVSEKPIPQLIEYNGGYALTQAYTMSGRDIIMTSKSTFMEKISRRYNPSNAIYGFFDKGKLVVSGLEDLSEVLVDLVGYFRDPISAQALSSKECSGTENAKCKPVYEYDLFMPSHIQRRVVEVVRNVVFRKLSIPLDNSNNSLSDIQAPMSNENNRQRNA